MMEYKLSEDAFENSFGVKLNDPGEAKQLKHTAGKRIKVFPFSTHRDMPTIDQIIGNYLRNFSDQVPGIGDPSAFISKLRNEVETDSPDLFERIVTDLYFEKSEKGDVSFKPFNLEMMSTIDQKEQRFKRLAAYLSSVLGENNLVKEEISRASGQQKGQSTVLEKFIVSQFEYTENGELEDGKEYFKVTNCLDKYFAEDLKYVLQRSDDFGRSLKELLSLYYLSYTMQSALQLIR